jgi:putative IMPACT (imprinted ancient) family translation regulator
MLWLLVTLSMMSLSFSFLSLRSSGRRLFLSMKTTLSPKLDLYECELEVKKSVFIARAKHCESLDDAMAFLARVKDSKASHNCYAWKDLAGTSSKSSDDGEPAGTAGRPILGAIENSGVVGLAVVVTRYFGGIELG